MAGEPVVRTEAIRRLASLRATAALYRDHPELSFSLLHWVVDMWTENRLRELFYFGASILAARCRDLDLHGFLPVDRVWVGVRSAAPAAFGGFHYPRQGYRHIQMGAVITRYGDLTDPEMVPTGLVALDLLRAYAHDCLHYGSFRVYTLHEDAVVRIRYGLNRRDLNGNSYSARDQPGSRTTRNLGVVTEGATDREARRIARQAAEEFGLTAPPDSFDGLAFRDTTGQLTETDRKMLAVLTGPSEVGAANRDRFLAAMAAYEHSVNTRYETFLVEVGGTDRDHLHTAIVNATVGGDLSELNAWLDLRHGPNAFEAMFRAKGAPSNGAT